jgi:hypothetical protein
MHPGYAVLHRLRSGEEVDINNTGIVVKMVPGELTKGDDYVGARNTVNLLTVERIVGGAVYPREVAYCFDTDECIKVEVVSC